MILSDSSALGAAIPTAWDSLAGSLGCSQKVSQGERAEGARYVTEYLPRDQSVSNHTRSFTVTLYPLPGDPDAGAAQARAILDSLTGAARKAGAEFRECVTIPTPLGDAAFLDYSTGGEHIAAAAVPISPGTLALYQLTARNGAIPSLSDVLVVRSLTAPK